MNIPQFIHMNLENKSISDIAVIIRKDWKKVNYAAKRQRIDSVLKRLTKTNAQEK